MVSIVAIETPSLGDRSYLVHDGTVAFVVDPQRDIDRILAAAERAGVRITHVFETHIHNDYVTGGYALGAATGAGYHINAADPVTFDRVPVSEGDAPRAVFTGGSLLYGSVGRPDLLGPDHTHDLVRHQYASAQRLATELPGTTALYPTHGFGSFCSVAQSEASVSTLADEKQTNSALTRGEREFIDEVLAGLDAWPAYYAYIAPVNQAGPAAPDLSPPRRATADELRRLIGAGEWVVDLRNRVAFAAGHVAGTLNFGLDGSFATYLGWLIPWGTPVTLLGETAEHVAAAQRELVRIGVDRPAAHATGRPADWAGEDPLAAYPRATFADLAQVRHHRPVVLLDVRRALEWKQGHLPGAVHIPLHDLPQRLDGVPAGEVWVHCSSGYRAAIAASLLQAAGRRVVHVDDEFTARWNRA
jgi:hydroxyacylglutathione hydrolase